METFSQLGLCRSLDEYERLPLDVLDDARTLLWARQTAQQRAAVVNG